MNFSPYTKAALVADSLSLATHWVYNPAKLQRLFPDGVYSLHAPLSDYHPHKKAGDLTHYGDQTIWLAELLAEKPYSQEAWKLNWLENMSQYRGYVDGASQETLANNGAAQSSSKDLAGASRIAPLFDTSLADADLVQFSRSQTELTHANPEVIDSAVFFARAVIRVKQGYSFQEALHQASAFEDYKILPAAAHFNNALNASKDDIAAAGSEFGLTCYVPEAFPLTLYFLLHHGSNFADAISKNALAGGDTSARAMLLALFFVARDGDVAAEIFEQLHVQQGSSPTTTPVDFAEGSHMLQIDSNNGKLSGVLEYPEGPLKAVALFAHCFTCGKDFFPAVKVSQALSKLGIATLRVDFSGVGKSDGEFEATSFLTNLEDLYAAADWLKKNIACPSIIIGHSLGGAAAYAVARDLCDTKAIVSIGAPADPAHVLHLINEHLETIEREGVAEVNLAGRSFKIGKKFIDDLKEHDQKGKLNALTGHKLVMHSPDDSTVPIDNAREIYSQLQHPKSFISLAGADHLLTNQQDAEYVANIIAVWSQKALE